MSDTKVILLEDDRTLASALSAVLSKEGIEALVTSRPEEARDFLAQNRIATLFVDCLLPTENGVDFVKSIREQFPADLLDVVMMSGVFTDPAFVREALRDTSAIAFLKKPFNNDELLRLIKRPAASQEQSNPRKELYQLFAKPDASVRDKKRAIESLEEIHGFDLPLIYSLLVEARLSGHLNIVDEAGGVSGISFAQGVIVGVDIADKETMLGRLLIEAGFLMPEDLEVTLSKKDRSRIGDRLLQANMLSPHGFNIALSNQMSIRLSRTIVDQNVRVNFVAAEVPVTNPHVNSELFQNFLHDWIASKITYDWFKAHFTQWLGASFVKSNLFGQKTSALTMPLVTQLEGIVEKATSGRTLGELLDARIYPEETLYKSLHFLLTRGVLAFQERTEINAADRLKLMRKMLQQFANKNVLEIFELMAQITSTSGRTPEQAYKEFLELLGNPDAGGGADFKQMHQQLSQVAKSAYDYVRSGNRNKMKEEMMKSDVEKKLKASSFFEEGKNALQKAQYREGLALIQKAAALDPKLDRLHLHLAWAKIGALDPAKNKAAFKDIDLDLMQIAPEDKFDSLYSFVMGLYSKAKGDINSARKSMEKAIALDSSMILARRELTVLSSMTAAKGDLLDSDLKSLVGNFFSKKK